MRCLILITVFLLGGCSVAKAVITAPIKVGEVIYDTATQSQEEADTKRGKAARKAQEQAEDDARRAERAHRKAQRDAQPH